MSIRAESLGFGIREGKIGIVEQRRKNIFYQLGPE
jgi:hypothetical protein